MLFRSLRGTQLVTLSACDAGLGTVQNGEGVLWLPRAFLAAGAESCVLSLWKVEDETTVFLMSRFYEELLDGVSRVEALRAAQDKKLELIAGAELSVAEPDAEIELHMLGLGVAPENRELQETPQPLVRAPPNPAPPFKNHLSPPPSPPPRGRAICRQLRPHPTAGEAYVPTSIPTPPRENPMPPPASPPHRG